MQNVLLKWSTTPPRAPPRGLPRLLQHVGPPQDYRQLGAVKLKLVQWPRRQQADGVEARGGKMGAGDEDGVNDSLGEGREDGEGDEEEVDGEAT